MSAQITAMIEAHEAADAACGARVDRTELEALRKYAHEATKAITGLVGGGSEMFAGRIGEMFKADLPYCVERLRDRQHTAQRVARDAVLREKAAIRRAENAESALAYLLGEAEFAIKYVPDAAETLRARMIDAIGVAQAVADSIPSTPSAAASPVSLQAADQQPVAPIAPGAAGEGDA